MSRQEHPLLPEELMAYADGELSADQSAIAARHIETCLECRQTIANTTRLSHEMADWKVEEPAPGLTSAVMAEVKRMGKENRRSESLFAWLGKRRMWIYGFAGSFAVLLMAVTLMTPSLLRSRQAANVLPPTDSASYSNVRGARSEPPADGGFDNLAESISEPSPALTERYRSQAEAMMKSSERVGTREPSQTKSNTPTPEAEGPMIIRTVHLSLITKEFDNARSQIETIVRSANGYIEQLQVRGEIGSGRAISATLRVPVDRLDASLTELRKMGQLQNESQSSSDVSSQYVDLTARLRNARNTEQRFLALLRERTGSLKDVVEAEREISRVREEIETMDAQLKGLSKKVAYSTIQVELQEEFRANLQSTLPTTGTRLGNAAVNGYKLLVETIVNFMMVVLLYGPTIILLAILCALITLIIWRMQKRRLAKQA